MRRASLGLLLIPLVALAAGAVLGEEIELTGTAPAGETIYLFFTGPNLPAGGVDLVDAAAVETGDPDTFTTVTVGDDGGWRYRWKTTGLGIDPGTYTIYASDRPTARDDLRTDDAVYSTLAVTLRRPALIVETGEEETPETEEQESPATRAATSATIAAAALALLVRRPT
ncbi:hypothetical protein RJ40_00355 [Methanofollis aquaemaris]|uniref:Uncharacterized protein n=1 Tax=Methanofollis aquaemaris TaxID=126734 RepID=A0A8A3S333_9EURY|nr:hypothetical protein [Methanofollis aquaemaris]QSZ66060.1 hypothetical protein RJ40_00355 [Methanofollis aquaemaris]